MMSASMPTANIISHPWIRRLISLELDRDHFVIFGSGPLLAHGLRRDIGDLDVVARGPAWKRALELGTPAVGPLNQAPMVHFWGGRIEVSGGWISPTWNVDELIDKADVIAGIRFARLTDVLAYKRFLCRPKDIADICAIERALDTVGAPQPLRALPPQSA
jgi:hypothetical protein